MRQDTAGKTRTTVSTYRQEGASLSPGSSASVNPLKLLARGSVYVPEFAVAPHVFFANDDAISRKVSSEFLQVFERIIDVAVDRDVAVSKMGIEDRCSA